MDQFWEIAQNIEHSRNRVMDLEKMIKNLEKKIKNLGKEDSPNNGYVVLKYSKELECAKVQLRTNLQAMEQIGGFN